ncbi:circadian clock KaiB family protein [filamentous cyanobacterium LEGE 11480]|uniref:Circadian clock KaiB family protein n=2 Tax=Romeriopsis TaxID=2992131 RepID=A0A928Z6A3_9CYAN|nr:circadian clock KaiB family protein [Romeriopsis navalis LEGE 11480]
MTNIPASFKGIALFTPAGDLVYCIDPTKQGRWHAQLCSALQEALNLPELPHFLVPCYTATVDRWWDETAQIWQIEAELSPNIYRYRALLNTIFELEDCQWNRATISPGVCDPLLLYRYQELFPALWESHNLVIALDSTQPIPLSITPEPTQGYVLRLFVAGYNQKTENTLKNLHEILEESLNQPYTLTVIDITKDPEEAETHQITATPTLLRMHPPPEKRLVGNLDTESHLLRLLGL